ncbi:DUF4232 domain-containing protein [Kribbella sp. NPDC004875]|uniref:DUF4232 domain-containing protein n=1 Tax=Kribbella sp. NPDC004875 TaxID=3364107 RepID=UPI003676B37A
MFRQAWPILLSGLLLLSGCGTETAATGAARPAPRPVPSAQPTALPTPAPTPSPTPPRPTCPDSGASVTVGPVEAALGHRAVVVKLTNCRSTPIALNGYPEIAVLDARRRTMNVKVTRGSSYMALDRGPTRILLHKGQSALAAVSWSNTVEVAEDKISGTYLAITARTTDHPIIWPVDTDLGTTSKLTLTAWGLTFKN